jgi:hypothetical protein
VAGDLAGCEGVSWVGELAREVGSNSVGITVENTGEKLTHS